MGAFTSSDYYMTGDTQQEWEYGGFSNIDSGQYGTTSPDVSANNLETCLYESQKNLLGVTDIYTSDYVSESGIIDQFDFYYWQDASQSGDVIVTITLEYTFNETVYTEVSYASIDTEATTSPYTGTWNHLQWTPSNPVYTTNNPLRFRLTVNANSVESGEETNRYAGFYVNFSYDEGSGEGGRQPASKNLNSPYQHLLWSQPRNIGGDGIMPYRKGFNDQDGSGYVKFADNAVVIHDPVRGPVYDFNNDSYVHHTWGSGYNLGAGSGTDQDYPFSIAAWIKADDWGAQTNIISSTLEASLSDGGWDFATHISGFAQVLLSDSTRNAYIVSRGTTDLTQWNGEWIHLVVTGDGSSSQTGDASGIKFYYNGVEETGYTLTESGVYTGTGGTDGNLRVGSRAYSNVQLSCIIQDFRIYGNELTDDVIYETYLQSKGRPYYYDREIDMKMYMPRIFPSSSSSSTPIYFIQHLKGTT